MAADRPEPGLIKWSPNAAFDSFLHINLQHRTIQLYEPAGHARVGRFDWKRKSRHDDVPPLTTFDWSPSVPGLVAVGTSTGVVNLLRVDDGSNAYTELNLKLSRTCQAVAFNTQGKLAVGLDRVRNDSSLCIWDVNRLSFMESSSTGFQGVAPFLDATERYENGASVTSLKFFENNPNQLVAGVKGRGLYLYDLRDRPASGPATLYTTKCCNNLAIDYADPNYFASSALDHPGVMVWDSRWTRDAVLSRNYREALEREDVPEGGALRLNRAMDLETDPASMENNDSFIRSLRFSRDHANMLAVLSRAGQLRVMSTKREYTDKNSVPEGTPELLEVSKSYEMDTRYSDPRRKNDKIVSFDWITLRSPVPRPRLLVLRANGAFEVLEKPSFTSDYLYKVVPWQAPYRGLEEGSSYHTTMDFEPSQAPHMLGPLLTESLLSDVPLFGPDRVDLQAVVQQAIDISARCEKTVVDEAAEKAAALLDLDGAHTIADKLRMLAVYSQEHSSQLKNQGKDNVPRNGSLDRPDKEPQVQRERHERLLSEKMQSRGLPSEGHAILDHIMLLRAKEKYLFHTTTNQKVVADDPWLQDAWAWVAGAEDAAADGGMKSYPLDASYMGVYSIWSNDLGSKPSLRLSDGAPPPDDHGWERIMEGICKKLNIPEFEGVETKWPNHRRICLDICTWGHPVTLNDSAEKERWSAVTWATRTAARALFRGEMKEAVRVLKTASTSHQELFFVSLALQTMGTHGLDPETRKTLDLDAAIASGSDPYLRALSTVIATGEWERVADQTSLPLRDRVYVAVKHCTDEKLTSWLDHQLSEAIFAGDIEGIVLTGITDTLVDILAKYVEKYHDYQSATLLLSTCAPRFVDDIRATAFRNAYRAYLQRHHAFFHRTKFEVESTKRSKHLGRPTILPAGRQIALRCVYCDAEMSLSSSSNPQSNPNRGPTAGLHVGQPNAASPKANPGSGNPFTEKMTSGGISCPTCKKHLPRCAVCLEIVGLPDRTGGGAGRFPTFCLACEHVLHLDHAAQWFARHQECPVPECRCKCNFKANPELSYH